MPRAVRIAKSPRTPGVARLRQSGCTGTTITAYAPWAVIFAQTDAANSVMYLQDGTVKLSVMSRRGNEAIIGMITAGAFFAERALVGGAVRHESATAVTAATVLSISNMEMTRLLREKHEFSERFMAHVLARSIRLEADVVDQLLNSAEKRLARALWLHGHRDPTGKGGRLLPGYSQQMLAEMVGTTRSRVNFYMNKFKTLGYIDCSSGVRVNDSLAAVLLED